MVSDDNHGIKFLYNCGKCLLKNTEETTDRNQITGKSGSTISKSHHKFQY